MELAVRSAPTVLATDGPVPVRARLVYLLFYLIATSAIGHALLCWICWRCCRPPGTPRRAERGGVRRQPVGGALGHGLQQGREGEPSFMDHPESATEALGSPIGPHGTYSRRREGDDLRSDGFGHPDPKLDETSLQWSIRRC